MSFAVTFLACLSAAAYVWATILVLKRRGIPQIGSPALGAFTVAAFVLDRFFPQEPLAAAVASAAALVAVAKMAHRHGMPAATLLAMLPPAVMLLVAVAPFFPAALAVQLQILTIALLCAGGPVALISLLLGRSAFRTTSDR